MCHNSLVDYETHATKGILKRVGMKKKIGFFSNSLWFAVSNIKLMMEIVINIEKTTA